MHPVLELLRDEFAAFEAVCADLGSDAWERPTECPGWTVKDNLSHICGVEAKLLGREEVAPVGLWPEHVKNEMGARNEAAILRRRPLPPEQILDEYRELVAERMKELEQVSDDGWDSEQMGVLGRAPLKDIIAIRVVDIYYHEQDIRRAAPKAGHLDGGVPQFVLNRMQGTIPRSLAKEAKAPAGTTLVCDVTTPPGRPFALEVREDGRAHAVAAPDNPTVTARTTSEGLLRLLGGRWNIEEALADGRVGLSGDPDLGRRILESLAATP